MTIQVKQFNCPHCAAPIDLKNAGRSRSIICPSCGSQIDLTGPEYQVVGQVGRRPAPKMTPFALGMRGTVDGEEHEIIGRVRYRDDEDTWDEWLLLTAAGDYRWISEDEEEGMVLWHSFTPTQPVDPNTLRNGSTFDLGEGAARVRERGRAVIDYLEGELTWKARVGEAMQYIDAEGAGELFSIEWTANEIEFWRGKRLNAGQVAGAFGITAPALSTARLAAGPRAFAGGTVMALAIVCILLACIGAAVFGSTSSADLGSELICNTPVAGSVALYATPTPAVDLSEADEDVTPTPPPNCYYRPRTAGPGVSGLFNSIRSGSPGRGISGSGK